MPTSNNEGQRSSQSIERCLTVLQQHPFFNVLLGSFPKKILTFAKSNTEVKHEKSRHSIDAIFAPKKKQKKFFP
jgi:hypothetical protein